MTKLRKHPTNYLFYCNFESAPHGLMSGYEYPGDGLDGRYVDIKGGPHGHKVEVEKGVVLHDVNTTEPKAPGVPHADGFEFIPLRIVMVICPT